MRTFDEIAEEKLKEIGGVEGAMRAGISFDTAKQIALAYADELSISIVNTYNNYFEHKKQN